MAFINKETKEINCKIAYYGPPLGGKTTIMQHIYHNTDVQSKSKCINESRWGCTIMFFDFLPGKTYMVDGFNLRYHLYTTPGAQFYEASRLETLKDVDGVIYVADSQIERMDANIEYLWKLENQLKAQGDDLMTILYLLQLNKRDLPNILTVEELKRELIRQNELVFESVAYKGIGVYETFNSIATQIWQNIQNGKHPVRS